MLVSPGTFYRGAALIMASDLAATPHSGVTVQLCGDAHLSNFGLFGSSERQLCLARVPAIEPYLDGYRAFLLRMARHQRTRPGRT